MHPRNSLGVLLILLGASPVHGAQDWPHWRGAQFDDSSPAVGVFDAEFDLRVRWRRSIGSGYSPVSVLDGVAVTLASEGGQDLVKAFGATTGTPLWQQVIGSTFPGKDGAVDGPVSAPTLAGDVAIALGPFGHLLALDLHSGEERWRTHLAEDHGAVRPHWGFTTAPLVVGSKVIVQTGGPPGHAVTAFSLADGSVVWTAGTDKIEYQSPLLAELDGVEQIVGCGETWLFGLDPRDGRELWKYEHRGSDFYRRVVNPLLIEGELLFMKNRRTESELLSIGSAGEGFPVERLWRTRAIKQNYNMAVYHDGLVFGHNASFLTCIDSFSGERRWRSRAPGNGWVILVDGHLVVLTKAGTLHVAPASPDGFEESASLELFERLVWTPPSFAGGYIYARDSFDELACIEVVERGGSDEIAAASPRAPGSRLGVLAARLGGAEDPDAVLDAWFDQQESFPIVEGDRLAHFVFRGEAGELNLLGDMFPDGEAPMQRLGETDVFVASVELEPDARVGYQFARDFDEVIPDPRNHRLGEAFDLGRVSELVMPGRAEPIPPPTNEPLLGRLESFGIDSPMVQIGGMSWGGKRRVQVYLPPGYDGGDERYPVLYVNSGERAVPKLALPGLLDARIEAGQAPVIGVFVNSVSGYELARSQRDAYRRMLVEEVVPEVDGRYRTRAEAGSRAIYGFEEGGYGALFAALRHPEVFGRAGAQSVFLGSMKGKEELAALLAATEAPPGIWLDWGLYDIRDRFRQIDTAGFSQDLSARLRERGAFLGGGSHPDGDTYGCWQARLPSMLDAFYGAVEGE